MANIDEKLNKNSDESNENTSEQSMDDLITDINNLLDDLDDDETNSNDFDEDDSIVTLLSANGEEINFNEIAGIAYKGGFYAILQPVELLEGMADDEALVFKVTKGKDGEDKFAVEVDDDVIEHVFKEYEKLYDEAHKNDK